MPNRHVEVEERQRRMEEWWVPLKSVLLWGNMSLSLNHIHHSLMWSYEGRWSQGLTCRRALLISLMFEQVEEEPITEAVKLALEATENRVGEVGLIIPEQVGSGWGSSAWKNIWLLSDMPLSCWVNPFEKGQRTGQRVMKRILVA